MAESPEIDGLGLEELKSLLVQALEEIARLRKENAEQRDEIVRLKGLKGRPDIKPNKPSGMQAATDPAAKSPRKIGRRGSKRAKLTIDETTIIKVDNVPAGARRKGDEDFIVQDLVIETRTTLYRRERWLLASGETVVAPLPAGITSHFGPGLKRFVLAQYHQGQTTRRRSRLRLGPRLAALLQGLGLDISKRHLVRLHIDGQDAFLAEARDVPRTGLQAAPAAASAAPGITVDDTGARHKAQNGVCTRDAATTSGAAKPLPTSRPSSQRSPRAG